MLIRLSVFMGTVLLGASLVACGGARTEAPAGSTVAQQIEQTPTALTLDTVNGLFTALTELAGAPLDQIQARMISVGVSGSGSVDALDPAKPTEFNQYVAYPDGRRDVRPYDYGGSENYDALLTETFPANTVSAETLVITWNDSFNRVTGAPEDLSAPGGVTVNRNRETNEVEIYVVNGPERDRQTVYYDSTGGFLRVS
ncbi:hypothetical protein [Mycolicibacterium brumae]|uniref:Uncharacterized protein n=1 Tax=Mycolicibacterium brumae TaxID=85968 RepID=A0A2G5PBI7_9MYCO|nr:hypothetical protein [Mycolicibacterium brumae]MCV7193057.1 hypothetical protein [Mycolicibacterium brumae]PIB75373.1 hypothetical protein CQY22_009530 [Mycolicibacterium brumae]RWA22018.1 hypothetical protein MBRU_13615 [Mycolicibacterium brumae DSM 44177]UWW07941.1 hypothetical protein L2Z93_000976 [Mycolicibacterium brumae]